MFQRAGISSGSGGGGGWDETGTVTMTSSGATITLQEKPAFVYGIGYFSAYNYPIMYFFTNLDGEYTRQANYGEFLIRPDYNTYGRGSEYTDYDGDKTVTFKLFQSGDAGITIKWWAMYANS